MKDVNVVGMGDPVTFTNNMDVAVGFFTGTIGSHSGLFFASHTDITQIGGNIPDSLADAPRWGYSRRVDVSNLVKDYRPVMVTITINGLPPG